MARVVFEKGKIIASVNKNGAKFIRKIALDGMNSLVRQTPVDTGRAKANWGTSVGTSGLRAAAVTSGDIKTKLGKKSRPADFKRSMEGVSGYKLGQTLYLYNNLQYILPLEYGTSKQAPAGWIRNTAIQMQEKLKEIKDLV